MSVPQTAPVGTRVRSTVSASLAFANVSPALTRVAEVHDVTDVLPASSASLRLQKAVGAAGDVRRAFPGLLAPNASGTVSFTVRVDP